MSESLAAHLTDRSVRSAQLEHAMRFLIARWADYRSPQDMTANMSASGISADALQAAAAALTDSPALLDEAALALLSAAWDDPDLHDAVRSSIEEASTRLPVIEVGAIVVAATYGLWLLATGGKRSSTRTVRRYADGSYEETETTEWYDPAGPLRAVVDLVRPGVLPESPALPPPGQVGDTAPAGPGS